MYHWCCAGRKVPLYICTHIGIIFHLCRASRKVPIHAHYTLITIEATISLLFVVNRWLLFAPVNRVVFSAVVAIQPHYHKVNPLPIQRYSPLDCHRHFPNTFSNRKATLSRYCSAAELNSMCSQETVCYDISAPQPDGRKSQLDSVFQR